MAKVTAVLACIPLLLLLTTHLAYSRTIREDQDPEPTGSNPSFLEWKMAGSTETCVPPYGFLPCSSNVWGLLFLIVVYEVLLSIGGQYVGTGSNLFFEIIGPGVIGASLFQFLGTIPQIILVLVSALSGSVEASQQRARSGMGLLAGTTVTLLTLIWGSSVVVGSYDLSIVNPADKAGAQTNALKGVGVVTDVKTSYTARIMLISLVPFLVLLLANIFGSPGRRVVILIALVITVTLLFSYVFSQIFQPWIQNRRFEHLMNSYAQDKLLGLISRNGMPDTQKIQELFKRLDNNNNGSVSAAELRILLLGVRMDDEDLSKERDVESILASFDTTGDGRISQQEFIRGMTQLVSDLSEHTTNAIVKKGGSNSQSESEEQQGLLANGAGKSVSTVRRASNSWFNYLKAAFFVTVGTVMLLALADPLIISVGAFARVAHLSPFAVSYLAIPFATNYRVAVKSIASAKQKTQKSISLTLSALYDGVYMHNIISLISFLTAVYVRNVWSDVSREVAIVVIMCIVMTAFTSFRTTYARWMGYVALLLYPISIAIVYFLTSVR